MKLNPLNAISPIDGRYRGKTKSLSKYFSEEALIQYRVRVEIEYFISLCEIPLPQLEHLKPRIYEDLRGIYKRFSEKDAIEIKEIEENKMSLNKSILFTGTLQEMSRDRAKELAKRKGYKIASNVSKNLDILVYGEKSGSKLKKAKDLRINILNEKDFLNLIN